MCQVKGSPKCVVLITTTTTKMSTNFVLNAFLWFHSSITKQLLPLDGVINLPYFVMFHDEFIGMDLTSLRGRRRTGGKGKKDQRAKRVSVRGDAGRSLLLSSQFSRGRFDPFSPYLRPATQASIL